MAYPFCDEEKIEIDINQFIEKVSNLFNQEIVDAARSTGFVKRESKLTGLLFLSIFTFFI
ncbi:MAG: hypothetical protein DRR19_11470 [Candidatus Parabeggiatoa sp. nov. 1]|nr:MAG: hypothetical protein DRR19_11470 [Gammaproteobacteria bacterium]